MALPAAPRVGEGRTMASPALAALDTGMARLRVERSIEDRHRHGCRLLAEPGWLGEPRSRPAGHPELRRVETDLAFELTDGARPIRLRKAAYVDVGPLVRTADGCSVSIAWRASTLAPLFPVFAGTLLVTPTRLAVEGVYAPPGGGVGLLVDRAVLRVVATRTARWFLDRFAEELRAAD